MKKAAPKLSIQVLSLFPELFTPWFAAGILGKACQKGIVRLFAVNPRDYAQDAHKTVDDTVYGGGPGMLLKPDVFARAVAASHTKGERVIALHPGGKKLDRDTLCRLAGYSKIMLVCGRYEGFDARFLEYSVDERISIGDYVIMGGEAPALVLIEGIVRRLDQVVHDGDSILDDSYEYGLIEEDAYTRPNTFEGKEVPSVLTGGSHADIARFRRASRIKNTYIYRPDLLLHSILSASDQEVLKNTYEELFCGKNHRSR
ncbi:MAG: tRNA (guanosine(37)-N1)-methyltransferase TrmD [Spirochaetota bacterium]|jgi:tRNA (guanine37-N1)-methyltransferase|nr:tRNA (guanosine(37)-N1)-methyltransferase TrmD [Spirochaetota bacterium]